jgi:hypothetical protein
MGVVALLGGGSSSAALVGVAERSPVGEEELRATAGARAGLCGRLLARARAAEGASAGAGGGRRARGRRQTQARARARAAKGWEGRKDKVVRWAGPFLLWTRWAGPFLWAFLLFSPYSMSIDLLFFSFFQVLKYVLPIYT